MLMGMAGTAVVLLVIPLLVAIVSLPGVIALIGTAWPVLPLLVGVAVVVVVERRKRSNAE
jgi:nitrate/nitrite transporter NarK